jgi:hypothetical protein
LNRRWRGPALVAGLLGALAALAAFVWRDDIARTALDPKTPFQTYRPPPAPDYASREAWALLPERPERWTPADSPADVFFVHPTTYDGGREWNAPIEDSKARALLDEVMLPNYAAPYVRVGRVFAPRYRQASLYTQLTLREDAREARRFAYGDVRTAFRTYLDQYNGGRAFLLVGVEQGGTIAARLLAEEVAPKPEIAKRLIGAHLIETIVPAGFAGAAPCGERAQARCVLAYLAVREDDAEAARRRLKRALVWDGDRLTELEDGSALCVNPVLGARTDAPAPEQAHLGAANATGLEWGLRPGFMPRQVRTRCQGGVLYVSRPKSPSLRPSGGWAERRRAPPYNLFYADLEADARVRLRALNRLEDWSRPAPPIDRSMAVEPSPIHSID